MSGYTWASISDVWSGYGAAIGVGLLLGLLVCIFNAWKA